MAVCMTSMVFMDMGCSNSSVEASNVSGVNVRVKAYNKKDSLNGNTLVIELYKYNPMLADASATLVDKFTKKLDNGDNLREYIYQGIICKNEIPDSKFKYYLTAITLDKEGKRVYYGYKDGKRGLVHVLDGNVASRDDVLMILQKI